MSTLQGKKENRNAGLYVRTPGRGEEGRKKDLLLSGPPQKTHHKKKKSILLYPSEEVEIIQVLRSLSQKKRSFSRRFLGVRKTPGASLRVAS